jgi:hypothetical protein
MAALVGRGLSMFATFGEKFGAKVGETVLKDSIKESAKVSEKLISKGVKFEGEHIGGELKGVGKLTKFAKKVVEGVGKASEKAGEQASKDFFNSNNLTGAEHNTFDALKKLAKDHAEKFGNPELKDSDADKAAQTALAVAHGLEMHPEMKKFYEANEGNQKMVDDIAHMHAHDAALKVEGDEQRKKMATDFANEHTATNNMTEIAKGYCKELSDILKKLDEVQKTLSNTNALADQQTPVLAAHHVHSTQHNPMHPYSPLPDPTTATSRVFDRFQKKLGKLEPYNPQKFLDTIGAISHPVENAYPNGTQTHGPEAAHHVHSTQHNPMYPYNPEAAQFDGPPPSAPTTAKSRVFDRFQKKAADIKSAYNPKKFLDSIGAISPPVENAYPNGTQTHGGSKRIVRSYKNKRKTVNKRKRTKYTKRKTVNKKKRSKYTKRKTVNKIKRTKYTKRKTKVKRKRITKRKITKRKS